jgi:hypothetical protein
MIGLICFGIGLVLGTAAQLASIPLTYDSESSMGMIIGGLLIVVGFLFLYVIFTTIMFGGIL